MRRSRAKAPTLIAFLLLVLSSCGGNPWDVKGAPNVPPDEQYRTGVEAGEDVYVWRCFQNQRVVVSQFGSACFGTRAPVITRSACGEPPPHPSVSRHALPNEYRWPGSKPYPDISDPKETPWHLTLPDGATIYEDASAP